MRREEEEEEREEREREEKKEEGLRVCRENKNNTSECKKNKTIIMASKKSYNQFNHQALPKP